MSSLRQLIDDPVVGKAIIAAVGLGILYTIVHFARRALTRYIDEPATRYRARKLLTLVWYFLILLLLSLVFRTRLAGLTVFLGIAGAGVAVAMQGVILSVAGWLTIVFGGVYRAGDRIQIAGIRGDVIDISILRTTIMEIGEWVDADLYSGRIVHVANNSVFREPVFNYTADFPFLWDEILLPVSYGSDYGLAKSILDRVLHEEVDEFTEQAKDLWENMLLKYRIERTTIRPVVTMTANENWVAFTGRYIVGYQKRRVTKDAIFSRLLPEIASTGGKVRIASDTVGIDSIPDLKVRLDDGTRQD